MAAASRHCISLPIATAASKSRPVSGAARSSAIASAAGTTQAETWICGFSMMSSQSNARASTPLANAAAPAATRCPLGQMRAPGCPVCVAAYASTPPQASLSPDAASAPAERVEQGELGMQHDLGRQLLETQRRRERRQPGGNAGHGAAANGCR